jgi:glycosyltransferase involved in cell wall biosynthesis
MYYRLNPWINELRIMGHQVMVKKWKDTFFDQDAKWADILILEMVYSAEVLKRGKEMGCKIVYELDDVMEDVQESHPVYKDLTPERKRLTLESISMGDVVTCTTTALKNWYKDINPNIKVLPNYLYLPHWLKPYHKNCSDTLRIGWHGSVAHKDDLDFLHPIIKKVLEKNKKTKFIYVGDGGWSGTKWTTFNFGNKDYFKDIPFDRREYLLGSRPDVWADKLASLQLDIGLAPILKTKFSPTKSTCKYLEYSIARIPTVYQKWHYGWKRDDGEPYVKDGETGLLADTPEEWEEKIQYLIDNPKERERIAKNAFHDVIENYNWDDHAMEWHKVYKPFLTKE